MKKFIKEFIVLSTLILVPIIIIVHPISILWFIAFCWALDAKVSK